MNTKQRGSAWSIALVFNLYKLFGYKFIYFLMYPVSFFYFIFASNVKESLKIYYGHLNIPFTNKIYFEHLRLFAVCMVDRFISKIDSKRYSFEYQHKQQVKQILDDGCILLFSHFGGWASASCAPNTDNKIHIVMKEVLLEGIKKIEDSVEQKSNNLNIIDLNSGGISVSVQVANALMNNEIVAIMADRASDKKYEKTMPFFNDMASFNKNPFQIAYKTNKPILVFFIIYDKMQTYKIEYLKITLNQNISQEEAIMDSLTQYIQMYESILKKYPNQWFNFYNFWENK